LKPCSVSIILITSLNGSLCSIYRFVIIGLRLSHVSSACWSVGRDVGGKSSEVVDDEDEMTDGKG
jgi:hypothetical protein